MHGSCVEEASWLDVLWLSPLWQIFSALERLSSLHPVSILARKRLDVSFQDLGRACRLSIKALVLREAANEDAREEAAMEVSRAWSPARPAQRQENLSRIFSIASFEVLPPTRLRPLSRPTSMSTKKSCSRSGERCQPLSMCFSFSKRIGTGFGELHSSDDDADWTIRHRTG